MKKILLPLLLLSSLCGEVLAEKLTFKFTRSGSGGGGGTILWQGIVVDVEGNTVSPRYTVHHRVFFSRWDDFSASAVQACERDPDGFSTESNCITSKSESITIPEEKSPFDYSYKFLFTRKNESKSEESFMLDRNSLVEIEERKNQKLNKSISPRDR